MTVYQFAFNHNDRPPTGVPVVDCRAYMRGCFSEAAARRHSGFRRAVARGRSLYRKHGAVGIACQQGRHRSVAVARAVADAMSAEIVRLPLRINSKLESDDDE